MIVAQQAVHDMQTVNDLQKPIGKRHFETIRAASIFAIRTSSFVCQLLYSLWPSCLIGYALYLLYGINDRSQWRANR